MRQVSSAKSASLAAALVAVAGLSASAQPSELRIKASPRVVLPGTSARIDVSATIPSSAYALASVDMSVHAPGPAWGYVTSGVAAGGDVLGVSFFQPHAPWLGVMADPANPAHVWTGRYTPASPGPAFIKIEAVPTSLEYYPDILTGSTFQDRPASVSTTIFVNPMRMGPYAAAPGEGDSMRVASGAFAAADEDDDEAILIGMLLPAVQKVREAEGTVCFDKRPTSLALDAEATGMERTQIQSLNFARVEFRDNPNGSGRFKMAAEPPPGAALRVYLVMHDGKREEVPVVQGRIPIELNEIPPVIAARIEPEERPGYVSLGWHFSSAPSNSRPGGVNVLMADGSVRFVKDAIVVTHYGTRNNLKQFGLASVSYESTGASCMTVKPTSR